MLAAKGLAGQLYLILIAAAITHIQACYVLQLFGAGFAANANCLLTALSTYGALDGPLYVNETEFTYKCSQTGGWEEFFEVDRRVLVPLTADASEADWQNCTRLTLEIVYQMLTDAQISQLFTMEMGARLGWKPKPHVLERVGEHMEALSAMPGSTIAFHVRGGDKYWEDKYLNRTTTGPHDYVNAALRAWPDVMASKPTCILIGDDRSLIAEVQALLTSQTSCSFYFPDPYWREEGHDQAIFNQLDHESRCAETIKVLVDLELLARADFSVMSYTSGWAHLVESLRGSIRNKMRWTFVDASAIRNDVWDRLRRHFNAAWQ